MKKSTAAVQISLSALGMLVLILDAKTALAAAREGIQLVIGTVLPSLFPFIFLSSVFNQQMLGRKLQLLRPLYRLCGVPEGGGALFLLGLIGGYPVGAQAVTNAYAHNRLDKYTAERLLGFCSNAGPAFVFGMLSPLFSNAASVWALWLIHIASAVIVGMLLPGKGLAAKRCAAGISAVRRSPLEQSIRAMGKICAWVILFCVLQAICVRWILWLLPEEIQVMITGLLELSNGCCQLIRISDESLRFILAELFLSLGGVCICMQTVSVTHGLGTGFYIPGKLLQASISVILCLPVQGLLYGTTALQSFSSFLPILLIVCTAAFIAYGIKKSSSISVIPVV